MSLCCQTFYSQGNIWKWAITIVSSIDRLGFFAAGAKLISARYLFLFFLPLLFTPDRDVTVLPALYLDHQKIRLSRRVVARPANGMGFRRGGIVEKFWDNEEIALTASLFTQNALLNKHKRTRRFLHLKKPTTTASDLFYPSSHHSVFSLSHRNTKNKYKIHRMLSVLQLWWRR